MSGEMPQQTPESTIPETITTPQIPPQQIKPVEVPRTFSPEEVVEFPDGSKATWGELQAAKAELEKLREAGADLYMRAMGGDQAALQEFVNRYAPKTEPTPPPQGPVDVNTLKAQILQDPEIASMRQFVAETQAQKSREILKQEISRPEYEAFAKRPDAVDMLIERLNAYYQTTGRKPDATVIRSALGILNKQEQEYQETLLAPFKQAAGDLGVKEPFRGGVPVQDPGTRPDPKDRSKYAEWLSNKLRWATLSGKEN